MKPHTSIDRTTQNYKYKITTLNQNMAQLQTLSQFSNTIPFSKSSNTLCGHSCYYSRNPELQLSRPNFNGVKAMKADPRDNYDQLNKPGLKRREAPAPIGLWDRFPAARTVQQMLETMDRVMEEPNSGWPSPLPYNVSEYVRGRTPWEIKEADGEYKMRFDMPGMTKQDVKIWVEERMLVIRAEKSVRGNDGGVEHGDDWSARSYGRSSSRIALPENVEFENIKAEVKDGVLYVTIPKASSSSSKIFSINVD